MSGTLNIEYSYEDVPTLARFAGSDAFIRGVMGPFGSGKSSACVQEFIVRGLRQKPGPDGIRRTRFAVVRNTYGELKDTTMRTVEQWLPERHFGRLYRADHRYVVKAFPGTEIELIYRALDKPDDVKHLLSLELTGAWVNEAREVPWSIIEALQGRVGRYPAKKDGGPTWSGIWMDTNPPDSDSKWFKFFEEKGWVADFRKMQREGVFPASMRPEEYADHFKQPSGRGPDAENLSNLPGKRLYYSRLMVGKSPEYVKIYVDGDYGFLVEGKLVYPEYIDQVHCREVDPVPGRRIIRSWDWGLTPACVFSQELPDGRWLIFDEMVSDNMSVDQFSDDVLDHCARAFRGNAEFYDVGDPAGQNRAETDARSCFDILQAKGIMVQAAASQDPFMRQESVKAALRRLHPEGSVFVIHPRCKVLRKGFMGGYHRRKLRVPGAERYSEQPDKNDFSHPHDALQYAAVELFGSGLVTPKTLDDDWPEDDRPDYATDATRSRVTGY